MHQLSRLHKTKSMKLVDKVHVYKCLHIALIKSTARIKSTLFLVRSSFLQAGYSFWPKRSGMTT